MFIVIIGNVIDGITIYGPFKNHDSALEWAENSSRSTIEGFDWIITEMENPNDN